ncbi:MAG: MFS transporter, partial [Thermodesulfobacteriota bacterium]
PAIIRKLLRERSFWIMMVLFSFGVGGSMGVFNMLPLYLVAECGLARAWANSLLAVSRVSGLFMAFVSGAITDRVGEKHALMVFLAASGAATLLLGLLGGTPLAILVLVQAALAACFFPPAFAALSRIGEPSERNVVISGAVPLAYLLGGGAIPALVGYMGDHYTFAAGLALIGALFLSGPVLVAFLKFRN